MQVLYDKQCQEQNPADTAFVSAEPSVEMIGDDECMLGHEEADVNMVSYALMMSRFRLSVMTRMYSFCWYTSTGSSDR